MYFYARTTKKCDVILTVEILHEKYLPMQRCAFFIITRRNIVRRTMQINILLERQFF